MADNPHASWFFKYEWDFDAIPTGGEFSNYMRALLCCANGDGQLQPGEREWVVGYAGTLGVPDELLDELRGYPADDDIAELIKDDTAVRDSRRAIIYDAVRACAADGDIAEGELATIRRLAQTIDVPAAVVGELVTLYRDEQQLKSRRINLVWPTLAGKPY
jgi:hypothetical protein